MAICGIVARMTITNERHGQDTPIRPYIYMYIYIIYIYMYSYTYVSVKSYTYLSNKLPFKNIKKSSQDVIFDVLWNAETKKYIFTIKR